MEVQMKYKNAKDIFPENLLKQIQRYVSGEVIYIPAGKERRSWGETSGYHQYLSERNRAIKNEYKNGADIESLMTKYHLSFESIRKILYQKEDIILDYKTSLTSAYDYASCGKIDEWIHTYLKSDGHNEAFSDGLKLFDRYYIGPMTMPTNLFHRCCGPEANMTYHVDAEWFHIHVADLKKVLETNQDMPPLIAHYVEHDFELNDGNHRLEAYNQLQCQEIPVIIWITEEDEYQEFLEKYGSYMQNASVIRR